MKTRKHRLCAAVEEVIAWVEDRRARLLLHWRGGGHTELFVSWRASRQHRYVTDAGTGAPITALARQMPDWAIAALLNRLGRRTGKGNSSREANVRGFHNKRSIPVYREGERQERSEMTLSEAATALSPRFESILPHNSSVLFTALSCEHVFPSFRFIKSPPRELEFPNHSQGQIRPACGPVIRYCNGPLASMLHRCRARRGGASQHRTPRRGQNHGLTIHCWNRMSASEHPENPRSRDMKGPAERLSTPTLRHSVSSSDGRIVKESGS